MEVHPTFFQAPPRIVAARSGGGGIGGPAAITKQLETRGLKRKFAEAFSQTPSLARIQTPYEELSTTEVQKLSSASSGLTYSYSYRELEEEDGNMASSSGMRPLQLPDPLGHRAAYTGPPRKKARMCDAAEAEQQQWPEDMEKQGKKARTYDAADAEQQGLEDTENHGQQELEEVLNPDLSQVCGVPPGSEDSSVASTCGAEDLDNPDLVRTCGVPLVSDNSSSSGVEQGQPPAVHQDSQGCEEKKEIPRASQWTPGEGKKVYRGHKIYPVEGDGRCLFRAVVAAFLINHRQWTDADEQRRLADDVRQQAMNFMVQRRAGYEWIIEGDFDAYVARMRRPSVWGGEPELLLLSHVLNQPIVVHVRIPGDSTATMVVAEYGNEYSSHAAPLRVLYDGVEHYSALVLLEDMDPAYLGTDTDTDTSSEADYGTDLD